MLASLLYPYDDDAKKLVPKWLAELEREKCVVVYVVDGSTYLQIINWTTHQKIDKPSGSKIPQFDESSRILASESRDLVVGESRTFVGGSGSGSGSGSGREGKGSKDIPGSVNADAFRLWIEYRRAERKPIKPHSYPALFAKFERLGDHAAQAAAVEHSIGNAYQGLFAEKPLTNGSGGRPPSRRAKTVAELEAEEAARAEH